MWKIQQDYSTAELDEKVLVSVDLWIIWHYSQQQVDLRQKIVNKVLKVTQSTADVHTLYDIEKAQRCINCQMNLS